MISRSAHTCMTTWMTIVHQLLYQFIYCLFTRYSFLLNLYLDFLLGSLNARRSVPADEPGKKGPFLALPFFGAKRLVTLRVFLVVLISLFWGYLEAVKFTHHMSQNRGSGDPSIAANTSLFLIVWPPTLDLMAHWRIANASLDSLLRYEVIVFFFVKGRVPH